MPILLPLVVAAVSTAIPTRTVDASWGVLARAGHYHGTWHVDFTDGTRFSGDWIVVSREPGAREIQLVDSRSKQGCRYDRYLYCPGKAVRVASDAAFVLPRGTLKLDGGVLEIDTHAVMPSLADEEMLFERTRGKSLADYFGAQVRRERGALVIVMPFREQRRIGDEARDGDQLRYVQETVIADATIRITAPAKIEITARETQRYLEDCASWAHAASSCGYYRPACVRR